MKRVVDALVGSWSGHGEGGYPTIESFSYREELTIRDRPDHPALHYEQRAWRKTPEGEAVSHWETGLIRISSDGTVTLSNAQGGRVEAMTGSWHGNSGRWSIELRSSGFAGDDRVLNATRTIQFDGSSIEYDMAMETTATREMIHHLEAHLTRRV